MMNPQIDSDRSQPEFKGISIMYLQKSVLLVLCAVFVTSCFSVPSRAPFGPEVKVLSADAPVEVSRTYQRWFILFGLVPATPSDEPRNIIQSESLVEVRVIAEDTLMDVLIGGVITVLTVGIISPQTVIVEGNRAPTETE